MVDNKTKVTDFAIMKALFPIVPPTWDKRISFESQEYWNTAKTLIASPNFQPIRNEIFENLINRIALVKIRTLNYNNPLKMFKRGELAFGDVVQEIATDIIEQQQFGLEDEPDQFKKFKADVQSAYHRINRQVYYPITIEDARMCRAFTNEGDLQTLIGEILSKMGGSNEIDEYIYTKQLFDAYYKNTEIPLQPTQILKVPNLTDDSSDKDIKKFILTVKKTMRKMAFPSRNYTTSGIMNNTNPSDMTCFLTTDYASINEVNNLSSAFRPEYLDLNVPIIGIDDFADDSIVGVILDSSGVDIYDNLRTIKSADNALGLYRNHFYHIWQTYLMSPFKNVIYLVKE